MNKQFTTGKGSILPLLDLRGKDYLEVKYRLVWFREDHPDWSIETNFLLSTDQSALAKATVRDEDGRVIATSHKSEKLSDFPDFMEKAETGAIGRALALIGYGTQFCADELDEGDRIVDAPVSRVPQAVGASSYNLNVEAPKEEIPEDDAGRLNYYQNFRIGFGKYRGKKLGDVNRKDLEGYLGWLQKEADKKHSALSVEAAMMTRMAQLYFELLDKQDDVVEEDPFHDVA